MSTPSEVRPRIRVCPAGPLLVEGATSVTTEDGREHAVRRPVVALCRCGRSGLAPYCDSTHKTVDTG